MRMRSVGYGLTVASAVLLMVAPFQSVHAQEASSDGYAIKASVSLLGSAVDALDVPAQAHVQFSAQTADYADFQQIVSLDETSALGLISLSTGDLTAETQYVAPEVANGFAVVATEASAASVELGAVSLLGDPLLALDITGLLNSRAMVSGYCPPATPLAFTDYQANGVADGLIFRNGFELQNLQGDGGSGGFSNDSGGGNGPEPTVGISVLGTEIAGIPVDPGANTEIPLLGLGTLILNEQVLSGDGIHSRTMMSNALRLTLNAALIEANVVVAHSEATLTCP